MLIIYLGVDLSALGWRESIDKKALVDKVKVVVGEGQTIENIAQLEVTVGGLDLGGEDGRNINTMDLGLGELVCHLQGPHTRTSSNIKDPQVGRIIELDIVVALEDEADKVVLCIEAVGFSKIIGQHIRCAFDGVSGATVVTASTATRPFGEGGGRHGGRGTRVSGGIVKMEGGEFGLVGIGRGRVMGKFGGMVVVVGGIHGCMAT